MPGELTPAFSHSTGLMKCGISLFVALSLAKAFTAGAQQTNHSNPRDFSAFQLITDRNIFDPNRRPRIERPVQRTTPRQQQIVDTFSLVGTMSYSNKVLAFFDGSNSDYRRSIDLGGKIAGFTTTEIRHDVVKLVQDTNTIELKVGMQMRRSEDGRWAAFEASGGNFNSYASNNGGGNSRGGWGRGRTRNGGGGSMGTARAGGNAGTANSDQHNSSETPETDSPDTANLDPNDPVARLMLRRLQEEAAANGGAAPQPPLPPQANLQPAEPLSNDSSSNDVPVAGNPPIDDTNTPQNSSPEPLSNENRN